MNYEIKFKASAWKVFNKLQGETRGRIAEAILALGENPRSPGFRKLVAKDLYRIRVGDYRIIYEIQETALIVTIIKVGHRRDVYRNF